MTKQKSIKIVSFLIDSEVHVDHIINYIKNYITAPDFDIGLLFEYYKFFDGYDKFNLIKYKPIEKEIKLWPDQKVNLFEIKDEKIITGNTYPYYICSSKIKKSEISYPSEIIDVMDDVELIRKLGDEANRDKLITVVNNIVNKKHDLKENLDYLVEFIRN